VPELTAASVAARLNLPEHLAAWVEALERLGPAPAGVPLPRGDQAVKQLRRLGIVEPDLTTIAEALPDPLQQPELWWLLERSYHQVQRDIGVLDASARLPSLPIELGIRGRCFWMFVLLAAADALRAWHAEHDIGDQVSRDTLADVGRHVARYRRRNGTSGLDSQWWLALHFRGALFALGRLQFNMYHLRTGMAGPLFWYEGEDAAARGAGFRPGDAALGVHVPAGSPLAPAACEESFAAAGPFFRRHFPSHTFRVATCTSWLLDDQLATYLSPRSNIVRFQQRFELVPGARADDDEVFRFVFDRVPEPLDDITPRTELERVLIRHVRDGGHWSVRTGWLEL
jgi:hypothetical protein